jgi:hypothetical protein
VRKYTFSALVTPGPAACRNAAPGDLERTRIYCVVQPGDHKYFPAVISLDGPPTAEHGVRAAVSMLLAGHEAAAFFPVPLAVDLRELTSGSSRRRWRPDVGHSRAARPDSRGGPVGLDDHVGGGLAAAASGSTLV